MKRLVRVIASLTLVAGAAMIATTSTAEAAGPGGALCQLSGNASISPPLSSTAQNFSYTVSGTVSGCQASDATAPASGTIAVGQTVTDAASGGIYQEPAATGNGSCATSTTAGTAFVTWADKTVTIVSYTTSGALAGVTLQGQVAASATLNKVGGSSTAPPTLTVTTTRYAGSSSTAVLAFHPADPTACSGAGVSSAPIDGNVGIGSPS